MLPPDLPMIAARVFERAQRKARQAIKESRLTYAEANSKLRPWAAAAALAGADIPLIDEIAQYLPIRARLLVAEEIMSRAEWVPVIAAARDAAMRRHHADPGSIDLEAVRDLARLCDGLRLAGAHAMPLFDPSMTHNEGMTA